MGQMTILQDTRSPQIWGIWQIKSPGSICKFATPHPTLSLFRLPMHSTFFYILAPLYYRSSLFSSSLALPYYDPVFSAALLLLCAIEPASSPAPLYHRTSVRSTAAFHPAYFRVRSASSICGSYFVRFSRPKICSSQRPSRIPAAYAGPIAESSSASGI